MQTHLWWQTSVTPAQSGWGSPGIPGAPSSGGRQGMQTACVRRQWHHVWSSAGQRWTTAWEPEQRARYRIKVLASGVRHVRPLAAVADVGDVALPRGGDGQVDLGAPRHVGTHAEEVLELGGRQGRVFVLRQRRSLCQNNNHHRIRVDRSQHSSTNSRGTERDSPRRTCQRAAAETADLEDWARWCSRWELSVWQGRKGKSQYICGHKHSSRQENSLKAFRRNSSKRLY